MSSQTRAFQNPLAMGGAPMAGAPAAGGRDDEREHKSASYLEEDDNVFGLDTRHARCAIISPSSVTISNVNNRYVDGSAVTVSRG